MTQQGADGASEVSGSRVISVNSVKSIRAVESSRCGRQVFGSCSRNFLDSFSASKCTPPPRWPVDNWTRVQAAPWVALNSREPPFHPQCKIPLTAEIPLQASRHVIERLRKTSLLKASFASNSPSVFKAFNSSLQSIPGL